MKDMHKVSTEVTKHVIIEDEVDYCEKEEESFF